MDYDIRIMQTVTNDTLSEVCGFLWGAKGVSWNRVAFGNDSICEIPEFYIFCVVPRSVAMHIETHKKKNGCYVWMATSRPDRGADEDEYSRKQQVRMVIKATARGLKEIALYRMCRKAEAETVRFMYALRKAMFKVNPYAALAMMPMCAYRNGLCTEHPNCGQTPFDYCSFKVSTDIVEKESSHE